MAGNFKTADSNNDGHLDKEEFMVFMGIIHDVNAKAFGLVEHEP